jgi:hypothetical protein
MPVEFEWSDDREKTVTLRAALGPDAAVSITVTSAEYLDQISRCLTMTADVNGEGGPFVEVFENVECVTVLALPLDHLLHRWLENGPADFRPGIHAAMKDLLRVIEESVSLDWTPPTYPEVPEADE